MVSFLGSESSSQASSSVASRSASPDVPVQKTEVNPLNPKGLKPCCACPETKSVRDECFLRSSPEEAGEKCKALVEAHKACMRSYGFKV
ncbi:hypothetical protein EHS25_004170 [Saitozyma podzolica]|uniref:Cytochrome c oxidase copper chaperone n=1 Tax=Saitozyma podzolica TaxID=1890683 RepID=A0A427YTF5_9TREE|nr:hypothetical protein EHS25_004170 [Saitozyma podzolica]